MFREEVKAGPLCAWLFCAMSAPLAQVAASGPWLAVLACGLGSGVLCWCVLMLHEGLCIQSKWYCLLQLLFLTVAASLFLNWSGDCWQTGKESPLVPLVLLVLAAFSAWNGGETASRSAATLFWLLALLFAVVLAAGVRNAKLSYLIPQIEPCSSYLPLVLLLPVVTSFLPREGSFLYTKTVYAISGFAAVLSLLCVGTLSPQVARQTPFAFYAYSKSLSILGTVERFEAFVSVALTMGYFCLLSLLLSSIGHLGERLCPGKGRRSIACAAVCAAAFMELLPAFPAVFWGCAGVIFWGILPCFAVKTIKKKKVEKI